MRNPNKTSLHAPCPELAKYKNCRLQKQEIKTKKGVAHGGVSPPSFPLSPSLLCPMAECTCLAYSQLKTNAKESNEQIQA